MSAPIWIRADAVLAIHRRQLSEHSGADGMRDAGLLASALARPPNLLAHSEASPDVAALAAAYAFGLARNRPFLDGNKRTAYVVCRTVLILNGHDLTASRAEKCATFLSLAEGALSEDELGTWIRGHLTAL